MRLIRGCGSRTVGALYLVGSGRAVRCDRLPVVIPEKCPTCGSGVKRSRGFSWLDTSMLALDGSLCGSPSCASCPIGGALQRRVGLMWIGETFYPTPDSFIREALEFGISKRIPSIPRELVLGQTWVFLAHPKAMYVQVTKDLDDLFKPGVEGVWHPGVIYAFKPTRIEMPIAREISEKEVEDLVRRGISPVPVDIDADGKAIDEVETTLANIGES